MRLAVRRIAMGPGEVAGYFSRLKAGFDALGIPCEHFVLSANPFGYAEQDYFLRGAYVKLATMRRNSNRVLQLLGLVLESAIRAIIFVYAIVRCDVFIFSGFASFFRFHELWLLKLLRKRVLVVYLGSDARPPLFSGRHLDDMGFRPDSKAMRAEMFYRAEMIGRVEKHATFVINHTATAQFFSREFIRLNAVGMPIGDNGVQPKIVNNGNSVRILHAPSRPRAKGSDYFRKIIDELRSEGYRIELIELIGVANSVVLHELQLCDFVLDELYSDVPLAMLGTEAALFGKPVIVGGYYATQYKSDNPSLEFPPSLYVEPRNIKDAVRRLIDDPDLRWTLGCQANKFVRRRWDAKIVAKNYLRLIEGDFPQEWRCTPDNLFYYWGWGLSKEEWRRQVRAYVESEGEAALMLDQHPRLKQMVLDEIRLGQGNSVA